MPARAAVHSLLEGDAELGAIGVGAVYASNSVDTPAEELFIVVKWEPTTMAFKAEGPSRLTVWAHDTQRDYGRIDKILHRVKEILPAAVHRPGGDDWTLTTAEWLGEGPDLYDGGYETITRYAEFIAVSRYIPS